MIRLKTLLFGYNFDYRRRDGVGRYAYELHKGLLERHYKHDILELDDIIHPLRVGRLPSLVSYMSKGYDMIHIMEPELGWFTRATAKVRIMTWHDMMLFTRTKKDNVRRIYHNMSGDMAYKNSDIIMCNSSKTRDEVIDYFNDKGEKKFFVISHGISENFIKAIPYKGPRKDFIFIGSIQYEHKNLEGLLKAFKEIQKSDPKQLLYIFTPTPEAENVLNEKLGKLDMNRKNIILTGKTTDDKILSVLKRCIATLHLTKEEGQGLPILESMAAGTPVIVLENAHIPKEVTKYAIKAPENKVAEEALALRNRSNGASKEAVAYAKSFTYDRTVKEALKVYKYAEELI